MQSSVAIQVSTMAKQVRGADIVARTLDAVGLRTVFTLSGNHIMPLFDAALETRLKLLHVRHEAAAVHMADAWARLTGQCGIALADGRARPRECPGRARGPPRRPTRRSSSCQGTRRLKELGRGSLPGTPASRDGGTGHEGLLDGPLRRNARP